MSVSEMNHQTLNRNRAENQLQPILPKRFGFFYECLSYFQLYTMDHKDDQTVGPHFSYNFYKTLNIRVKESLHWGFKVRNINETDFSGDIVFSRNIETVAKEITNFEVPAIWLLKSYSNSKNIGQFMKNLGHKFQFFQVILKHFLFPLSYDFNYKFTGMVI